MTKELHVEKAGLAIEPEQNEASGEGYRDTTEYDEGIDHGAVLKIENQMTS